MSVGSSTSKGIGILWDVDGTIADSYLLGFTSTNEVLKRHGKNAITEESYHEGTKFTTPRRLAWHVTGNPDDPIGQALGEEFDDLYVKLVSTETAALYDGMKELLIAVRALKPSIRFGALSNACGAYVRAVLEVNEIDALFGLGLGADEVDRAKPDPDGLWKLCNELNLQPGRCVYVGDSPTDGQAAKAAGMTSIGVTWGSHSKEKVSANFVKTVDSVADLQEALTEFVQQFLVTPR